MPPVGEWDAGRVGIRDRSRVDLAARGIDPNRLPPGQYATERFPVLHAKTVPDYSDISRWSLTVDGLVGRPVSFTWDDLISLPAVDVVVDVHCVTTWSRFDTAWRGVPFETLLDEAGGALADAAALLAHDEQRYSTNLLLDDCLGVDDRGQPRAIVATHYAGRLLEPEHGYPARFLVPHLYFWKSAKWLTRLELLPEERLGFWEGLNYHRRGDPFKQQRYATDD